MTQQAAATSILEFLTHPNPSVSHRTPKGKTNSHSPQWYWPKQLKRWDEFDDPNILESVFGGRLIQEARRGDRQLPPYPHLHPRADRIIHDENGTRDLIHKWNHTIVMAALDPVQHDFNPLIWCKGDPPPTKELSEPHPPSQHKKRTQPLRKSSARAREPKLQSLSRLNSDSGSIPWGSQPSGSGDYSDGYNEERFPKEYKPATKWRSEWMAEHELVDESGKWRDERYLTNNFAWPIRQAFTYSIQHMCRYGCILTCREAFIFRVKPRDEEPANGSEDPVLLRRQLAKNGLMEYVSIPWDNHREGNVETSKNWTVNLALWFLHILAGNHFGARWKYGRLQDEELVSLRAVENQSDTDAVEIQACESKESEEEEEEESSLSSDSDESGVTIPFHISAGTKRKRDSEGEEGYHLSFSKRQALPV